MHMMEARDRTAPPPCCCRAGSTRRSRGSSTRPSCASRARRYPDITPHFFSAPEIQQMVEVSGLDDPRRARRAARRPGRRRCPAAAPRSCPSACASAISPKKGGPEAWLDVHREAHRVGMRSTATMMYGHVETDAEDIVEHLDADPRAPAGRDRGSRLHRVRALVLQARQHADGRKWVPHIAGAGALPAHAGGGAALPRQLRPRPGVVVLRGQEDRPGRAALRRRRLRRHAVRGERAPGHRPREHDHGRGDRRR